MTRSRCRTSRRIVGRPARTTKTADPRPTSIPAATSDGIVGTDDDTPDRDDHRRGEEDRADELVEEEDRERDRKGRARVVGRERRVVRTGAPDVRRRMGGERPLTRPQIRERPIDEQRECCRGECRGGGELPLAGPSGAVEKPETARRDGQERNGHDLDDLDEVPEPRVPEHERVDSVVDAVVHGLRPR